VYKVLLSINYLEIKHAANAANAASCMVPMFLAAIGADCTPHGPKSIFYETSQIATSIICPYGIWIKLKS
jgi:hypothetical protein